MDGVLHFPRSEPWVDNLGLDINLQYEDERYREERQTFDEEVDEEIVEVNMLVMDYSYINSVLG